MDSKRGRKARSFQAIRFGIYISRDLRARIGALPKRGLQARLAKAIEREVAVMESEISEVRA